MSDEITDSTIYKSITGVTGSGESTEVFLMVDKKTGKSELVITKEIREYHPVTDYDKVIDLHERLNRSGRRCYSLEDLTK